MKRFVDKPRYTFVTGVWYWKKESDVYVVCPKCSEWGVITTDNEKCYFGNVHVATKGWAYQLPKFMKLAKNRVKVLKILKRMQKK